METSPVRALFEHMRDLLVVLDRDGRIVEINGAAAALTGLPRDALAGRAYADVAWPAEAGGGRDGLLGAIARAGAGEGTRLDVEVRDAAGRARSLELVVTSVSDGGAEFIAVHGRDVTEAKWSERALRVSEAKFAGIISISSDAIISVDESYQITMFNQGAERMFGYRSAEVVGRDLGVLLPERFRAVHGVHMRNFAGAATVARRMGERQEISGLRADGSEFPAEASISKLELAGSRVFTVVLRDITDRKRSERTQHFLAEAGSILASSLDYEKTLASVAGLSVPELADWCVVYIRQDDGSVRRLEMAHAEVSKRELLPELLKYPLDPRTPHPVFTAIETGTAQLVTDLSDSFLQAISQSPEHLHIYRELGMRSMMIVPMVARGETRGAMGFMSAQRLRYSGDDLKVAHDLALIAAMALDNARLYRDARAAVQARDDMIAVVSHDLGNPLSAIRIGTTLLLRTIPEEERATGAWQHLDFIRQSAQQMENLINDLLEVKRLESGKVTLRARDVRAVDIVRDVLDVFLPIAEQRSIDLAWTPQDGLPWVHADHERVVQLLSNLVGNAVKFTAPGGRVRVTARRTGNVVLFAVSDNGPGISPENLPHIFDRFWQGRPAGKTGLGLGLAIARGIAEAHGGTIWCESAVGAGTTFLFTLPVSISESDQSRPA
jgi:PAS domain S-box-containing protein